MPSACRPVLAKLATTSRREAGMTEQTSDYLGDYTRVATCATPTEAHLLKGVLEAAGLAPHVADANIVQANSWLTQAVGGVRVLVPAQQVEAAHEAIAEFQAGAYQLPGEESAAPKPYAQSPVPLFSIDRAALLSFILTPVFGAVIHLVNGKRLGQGGSGIGAWLWLALLAAASIAAIVAVQRADPGPFIVFRASMAMCFLTAVWYFVVAYAQSKHIFATFGPKYRRQGLGKPALLVALGLLASGWVISEFM
ncbi:DUF2007 domain-containing protein [Aquincola sp. S2]|uniref:DUF2007 domain-containing protein n=1 Tax=Pseudaquabacterium terrae TaxID=2732868 RepID=A0ABX2EAI9_9BURK|nr:DUF2007 domain-containing protein [Aquabacterium terrae]NRF65566.1 DUF2007 domain-containing protein [Aquabacterium terrae]